MAHDRNGGVEEKGEAEAEEDALREEELVRVVMLGQGDHHHGDDAEYGP